MPHIRFFHHPDFTNANGPLGYERTPQQPMENEPVKLAAAVEGCDALTLKLHVNGVSENEKAGKQVREEGGRRFFTFELDGYAYGSHVEYTFHGGEASSRVYSFDVAKETEIESFESGTPQGGCLLLQTGNPILPCLTLALTPERLVISQHSHEGGSSFEKGNGAWRYSGIAGGCSVSVNAAQGTLTVLSQDGIPLMQSMRLAIRHTPKALTGFSLRYDTSCEAVYGLGERYSGVNHIGQSLGCAVTDNYTNQGKATYFPLPLYYCDNGHGVFIDTPCISAFDFGSDVPGSFTVGARTGRAGLPDIHVFFGAPASILQHFTALAGRAGLPPKWAFGLWMSANRWNCQRHIDEQLEEARSAGYPADVVVIEAWSDEATFYIWNDAQYERKHGADGFTPDNFRYPPDGRWPDPQRMIDRLHDEDLRLVLWQIPVLKKLGAHEPENAQHAEDIRHALESGYCARNTAGEAYEIPNFWFSGSHVPDFTQTKVRDWWAGKREYLLAMGVDGFKTDGGEFIYEDGCTFADGSTGIEMKNGYVTRYLDTYADFSGLERVLFSRAGYTGSQRRPFHWAGDQQSTWKELRSVLNATLSLGMSGAPFLSFDIAGFTGPLPTAELYIRATELAAFAPAMQWHSDYMTTQPDVELYPTGVNDRSPWNIARATGSSEVMPLSLFYAWLHANLQPHLYSEAQKSAASGLPMWRHLVLEFPDDSAVRTVDDEFMLGDLLVAPIIEQGAQSRGVYLPQGMWLDVWAGADVEGGRTLRAEAPLGRIPLYLKHGGALALAMGPEKLPGRPFDRKQPLLVFLTAGEEGAVSFWDGDKREHRIHWDSNRLEGASAGQFEKKAFFR